MVRRLRDLGLLTQRDEPDEVGQLEAQVDHLEGRVDRAEAAIKTLQARARLVGRDHHPLAGGA